MFSGRGLINQNRQQGLALLLLVVSVALVFISIVVSGLSITEVKVQRDTDTLKALKKAKKALIAYAVNYPKDHPPTPPALQRGPGYLLCPDNNNDGEGESGCNGLITIGRFPWKTLNVGDLRDSANEKLWYAVSENYDFTGFPSGKVINTGTRGNITVRDKNNNIIHDGTLLDAAVAVIIAPGQALTRDDGVNQDRSIATGDPNDAINYLDIDTSSGEDNADFQQGILGGLVKDGFIQGEVLNGSGEVIVNDIIEVITYGDIMDAIHRRVAGEISNMINDYYIACGAYPEASEFKPTKASFKSRSLEPTPPPQALREGHLPLDEALPVNWGDVCTPPFIIPPRIAPVPLEWLAAEEWHKVSYYEYSYTNPSFPLPLIPPLPVGTACAQGVDCLTVNNSIIPIDNKGAVIVFAGRDLNGIRPVDNAVEYFEGENNDFDLTVDTLGLIYDMGEVEDYVRIITP